MFTENEIKDLAEGESPSVAQELSYSLLGSVKEDEIPPDIPLKTVESTQLLIGDVPPADGPAHQKSLDIYETPECESSSEVTFAIRQRSLLLSLPTLCIHVRIYPSSLFITICSLFTFLFCSASSHTPKHVPRLHFIL